MASVAPMASMVSMTSMVTQEGTDVEVPLKAKVMGFHDNWNEMGANGVHEFVTPSNCRRIARSRRQRRVDFINLMENELTGGGVE